VSVAVRTSLTFARAYECVCVRACVRACVRVPRAAALSRARSQRRGAASSHERVVELTPGAAAAAAARDRDDDDGEDDLLVPYAAGFLPSPSLPECCLPACLPACLPVCLSVCACGCATMVARRCRLRAYRDVPATAIVVASS
jgi:hypothetical protein